MHQHVLVLLCSYLFCHMRYLGRLWTVGARCRVRSVVTSSFDYRALTSDRSPQTRYKAEQFAACRQKHDTRHLSGTKAVATLLPRRLIAGTAGGDQQARAARQHARYLSRVCLPLDSITRLQERLSCQAALAIHLQMLCKATSVQTTTTLTMTLSARSLWPSI